MSIQMKGSLNPTKTQLTQTIDITDGFGRNMSITVKRTGRALTIADLQPYCRMIPSDKNIAKMITELEAKP